MRNLKKAWLNSMLHFSGVISKYKLKLIEVTGPKTILYGLFILLLEIVNMLIAIPAYALISSKEFAGNDKHAIKKYRLRRIISLSALLGAMLTAVIFILVVFFGLVIFPGSSKASVASWDFNTPLAYHYDASKIQIIDGTAIFKAQAISQPIEPNIEEAVPATETPATESTPALEPETTPTVEPEAVPNLAPTPEPTPMPTPAPAGPLLFDTLKSWFAPQVAHAETTTCFADLETIVPLVVTPFVKWTGFSETAQKNGGEIKYALSGDGGLNWWYFDGGAWADAAAGNANTAAQINQHISSFPLALDQTGAGTLMFRATFFSDCAHDVSLLSLTADYQDQPLVVIGMADSTEEATSIVTSENDATVVAVEDSLEVVAGNSNTAGTQVEIPVLESTVSTQVANDTSLQADTQVSVPSEVTETPSVDTSTQIAPTVDASLETSVATPISFSIHTVIETTGTPGQVLYEIPGLFSLSEGPDNGLKVAVVGTDLGVTELSLSGSANVSVGDHIVVVTYDGSKLSLYVDGSLAAFVDKPIVIAPPANASLSLGCVSAGVVMQSLSLAQINANYLQCSNQAPSINITRASWQENDGFIDISYTVTDTNADFVTLPVYEYSLTGAFDGEQMELTAAFEDVEHDGISGINASRDGVLHTFVWNMRADFPNSAATVYVRMQASDGLAYSAADIFYPVHVDTKAPGISGLSGAQLAGADRARIYYTVNDAGSSVQATLEISTDSGQTFAVPVASATGAVGNVASPNGSHVISWNPGTDLPNFEGTVIARISVADVYGTSVAETEFQVDTRAPVRLSAFSGVQSNTTQILWHWTSADDANFNRYSITYGNSEAAVSAGSAGSLTFSPTRDADLLIPGTDRTITTGLLPNTRYYAKVTAYDDYGHTVTSAVISFNTQSEVRVVEDVQNPTGGEEAPPSEPAPTQPAEEILGDVEVGEVLPDTSTVAPVGPFAIRVQNGVVETKARDVTLNLDGGNASLMLISNQSDLSDASLQGYQPTIAWDLCAGLDTCGNGNYIVYTKFYTSFGVGSAKVSDAIALSLPAPVEVKETPAPENTQNETGNVSGGGSASSGTEILVVSDAGVDSVVSDSAPGSTSIESSLVASSEGVAQSVPELHILAESRESGVVAKPQVAVVQKSFTGQTINFTGTGIPNAKIALFIHSDQVVVYTTEADETGGWKFAHDQRDIELSPGLHTVFAVTYDPGSKVKSRPSVVSTFEVKKNPAALVLAHLNLPTTLLTVLVLLLGTRYLYSLKRKDTADEIVEK